VSLIDIVDAISTDVAKKIAAAGLPPLVDSGQIVVGRDRAVETSAPPRIVFIPTSFRFKTRSNPVAYAAQSGIQAEGTGIRSFAMLQYGGGYDNTTTVTIGPPDLAGGIQAQATATVTSNGAVSKLVPSVAGTGYLSPPLVTINGIGTGAAAAANLRQPLTAQAVNTATAFLTECHGFEVLVWGINSTNGQPTPDSGPLDYVATQKLYAQVLATCQSLFPNTFEASRGQWLDASANSMLRDVLGKGVSFFLEVQIPVLREPLVPLTGPSIQMAPVNTQQNPALYMLDPLGLRIVRATSASPIVITTVTPHGRTTGQIVSIAGAEGNTAANGVWTVTVTGDNTLTLNGSTGNGVYTGGGFLGAESS
jgi:hypothetical protein